MEIDKIYNMDCLEWMQGMEDNSVDAIVTSPPYNFGLRIHTGKYTKWTKGETFGYSGLPANRYDNRVNDALAMEDYFKWQRDCITEMLRISKGVVFYNIMMITGNKTALLRLFAHFADNIRDIIIWDKQSSEPSMGERILNCEYEFIIAFDKADCKGRQFRIANFERGTMANVIRIGKNRENDHRAAFPLLLPQTLIHYFTNEGDIIADPFMGSATTAIAAIKEKRHFVGSELNKEYFDKAVKRINWEQRQLRLF